MDDIGTFASTTDNADFNMVHCDYSSCVNLCIFLESVLENVEYLGWCVL